MDGEVLSGLYIITYLKLSIIPLLVASLLGIVNILQEGGPENGSRIWAPIVWFLTIVWLMFFLIRGIIS